MSIRKSFTRITPAGEASPAQLEAVFAELEERALRDLLAEGFARERLATRRHAGMRYRGQSYELPVEVPSLAVPSAVDDLIRRFHAAHARRYGHMAQAEAVEIVNFQVTAIASIPKPRPKAFDAPASPQGSPQASPSGTRRAYFNGTQGCDVPVRHRSALTPGMRMKGRP